LIAIVLALIFTEAADKMIKRSFIIYTVFPIVGVLLDYFIHGLSLTYLGLVLSILIIYANIYSQKQKMIESQKNALMLSQINPHFVYNTLSTIASMCDTSPKQAKYLTIDFARYLRTNIDTLASYGVTAIIQPGGSVRDDESIQACDEYGIAMVFTGHRHFRH
jgi:hypothetical protein